MNPHASTEEAPEGRVAEVEAVSVKPAMAAKAVLGTPRAGRALVSRGPDTTAHGVKVGSVEGAIDADGTVDFVENLVPSMEFSGVEDREGQTEGVTVHIGF